MLANSNTYFFIALIALLTGLGLLNYLPAVAAVLVLLLAVMLRLYTYCLKANKFLGLYLAWTTAIILGVIVGLYRPSGFNYPLVFKVNALYEDGLPFSLYINIAKLFAAYLIIYFLISLRPVSRIFIRTAWHQYALAISLGALIVLIAGGALNLQFHLKPLKYIVMFGLVNLFVTCVAEEAFMRLLLQAQLQRFMSSKLKSVFWLEAIPLLIATLIFVAVHLPASTSGILVFGFAGLVYGLVYILTKNLWACVLVHFTVNIIHFSLLTYPLA